MSSNVTGTLIWYYYICHREVWLMARRIEPSQENPFIEIGRLTSDLSLTVGSVKEWVNIL